MDNTEIGTKPRVIDADAHVIESERTWDYLEPAEQRYRPSLYSSPDNPTQQFWLIGGKIRGFRFATLTTDTLREMARKSGRRLELPDSVREVDDVDLRLRLMDELGIDVQVAHNTLWIEQVSDRPDAEAALCRAWNRWMADMWKRSDDRIRWTCVFPSLSIDEALSQIKFAKGNGAVGVCIRPLEGSRLITDPYFHPVYELAQNLDIPMVVHIANANPLVCDLLKSPWDGGGTFATFRGPTVVACHTLMMSELPRLFPKLRWGFVEASAQWIPWVVREARNRLSSRLSNGEAQPDNLLDHCRIYVTCQNDDDIPYLIQQGFLDNLVIGTDFGHFDPSSDVDAITKFKENELVSPGAQEKILYHNPKALYGL